MSINLKQIELLKKARNFDTQDDIIIFEDLLTDITKKKDITDLNDLLTLFDDGTEFPEVMYSLVHAVESYPAKGYIKTLLNCYYTGKEQWPAWYKDLMIRILNSPIDREILKKLENEYTKILTHIKDDLFFDDPEYQKILGSL